VVDADLVAATESFPVSLPLLWRESWMAVLVAVVDIGAAVIFIVSPSAFETIVKTLTTENVELVGNRVPGAHYPRRTRHGAVHGAVDEVRHTSLVPAAEALTVSAAHWWRHIVRMPVFIAVVHVGTAMVFSVASCTFNAVVKTAALDIVPGIVGAVPAAAIVAILCEAGSERGWRSCVRVRCREQYECRTTAERCDAEPVEIH